MPWRSWDDELLRRVIGAVWRATGPDCGAGGIEADAARWRGGGGTAPGPGWYGPDSLRPPGVMPGIVAAVPIWRGIAAMWGLVPGMVAAVPNCRVTGPDCPCGSDGRFGL